MKKLHKMKSLAGLGKAKLKNALRCTLLILGLLVGANSAWAQQNNVYQHTGTQAIPTNGTLNYYDTGGASSANGDYYWEHWYQHGENSTLTFKDGTKPVKVTFNQFHAWNENGDGTVVDLGLFALRINNDHLYVYDGETADDDKLIVDLTGTIKDAFSVMANGPITFKFVSDAQYRDEGWAASVNCPTSGFEVPVPLIAKETCADMVYINRPALGAKIYYTLDNSQPTIDSEEYTAPFAIDLDASTASVTVKAIAIVEGVATSGLTPASHTFTHADQRPTPGEPTIEINGNTVTITPSAVPAGLNDTYYVRYTTDGSDPTASEGTVLNKRTGFSFEWHTPNTRIKAITQATDCPDKISPVVYVDFGNVTVPTPEISFDASGNATITCSFSQATIYYTTDGSEPSVSNVGENGPTYIYSAPFAVTPGTTVKAFANYAVDGYQPSSVASEIYVPEGGSGVYNNTTVLLDDREDHSWSYYSDKTNPIRSLNPADVKITYFGNGTNNISTTNGATPAAGSWTESATTVQVSYNETANQFVYLKTLERADGATSQNPTGNCAYTTIPNPFSKRPTYQYANGNLNRYCGFYGWRVKSVRGGSIQNYAVGATIPAETEIQFVPAAEYGMEVELEALWARAYVKTGNANTLDANNTLVTNLNGGSYERNFFVITSGNTDAAINRTQNPVTISTRYPDGTSGGSLTSRIEDNFTCNADTKFEYVVFRGGGSGWNTYCQTITGNGYGLVIGRGVTGYNNGICATTIEGCNDSPNGVNYKLRIESGTFTNLYFASEECDGDGQNKVTSILGCDFDRATNNNSLLDIRTEVKISTSNNGGFCQGSTNYGREIAHITVRSGSFQSGYSENGNTGNGTRSFYICDNSSSNRTVGRRVLIVEGGEFLNIAGGMDPYNSNAYENVYIRIKGGHVKGSIYGAAAQFEANGDRRFIITGGTINGWIAGGCNGTATTGGELHGNTYIYLGGNSKVVHTANDYTIQSSKGGNIFGAGSGINGGTTVGRVDNSTVVIADNTEISRNVFGGGNYGYVTTGTDHKSDIFVLGGKVNGSVFGGSNQQQGQIVNITMKDGTVEGNLYGGSNTSGTVNGLATINMSGGTVSNVFGGGYGSSTSMAAGTAVNVSGGTINNNVYGGGEQGSVTGNTDVTISGGTMHNVYGAGLGTEYTGTTWPPAAANANITGTTTVSVSGGTMDNVYGGGENGSVAYSATASSASGNSTVSVSGGEVKENVFGGGENGTTQGTTIVNVSGGNIRGNVFGGALGAHGRIYVTGMRTVNILDGHVYGNVYGGSRNANDGNDLSRTDASFSGYTGTEKISVTNISGGIIDQNVYAAGYYGSTFGSVYVFVGKNAIENAPEKAPTAGIDYAVKTLSIAATVWAGGDWGTFSGQFGSNTVSGNSNIYVDGTDYNTETQLVSTFQYMNIGGSLLGCGTSCHAGKGDRTIVVRNYGIANGDQPESATRSLFSIQFAKTLIFDNANVNFTGQGRINSLVTTEKYGIYEIANGAITESGSYGVRLTNGSGLFLNAPVTQIANFKSMQLKSDYADLYEALNDGGMSDNADFDVVTPTTLSTVKNKVRVNHGIYVEVKYVSTTTGTEFGPVIGYAYMMASNIADDATCAYARPRWCYLTPIADELNNPDDGGWVSYTASENTFDLAGNSGSIQMPYENHTTRNAEQYFRVWRVGGTEHYREDVFDAAANGTATFSTVDVTIVLPAFRAKTNYYRFETIGDGSNTSIDYGPDVLTFNAANYAKPCADGNWMYYDEDSQAQVTGVNEDNTNTAFQKALTDIKAKPDVNFGLVAMPGEGLNGSNYIICQDADNNLAESTTKFGNDDNTEQPSVVFRLTYYNKLSANMTWDPMTIVLLQCDEAGNVVDRVTISLAVNTSASIEQEFTTQVYAIMQGTGSTADTYSAKVVLPTFNLYTSGEAATFTLNSVNFVPANDGVIVERATGYDFNRFAVDYAAGYNYDNTRGWDSPTQIGELHDTYPFTQSGASSAIVGYAGGRTEFAIDFTLHYDGSQTAEQEELMGTLTYNITFDNYENGTGANHTQPLTIVVQVYRRGQGNNFYLDGVNGSNSNSGRFPNDAVKQLSTIFNRCGFLAGDVVYVVNKVTANNALTWNGQPYSNVTVYRYNGGHTLKATPVDPEDPTGETQIIPIVDNPNNDPYLGELLVANNTLTITGITMDGYYRPNAKGETPATSVNATAPLIVVNEGGVAELTTGTVLQNNNNSGNGGGVMVNNGGVLRMNRDAQIKDNVAAEGAGVYMAGNMIASDDIQIVGNKKGTVDDNVYLSAQDKVITIGTAASTDEFGPLSENAKIGVTKQMYGDIDGYTRVVNVDADVAWLETPYNSTPNAIIYHDGGKYQLEKYSDPKYLYWIGTWVTLQDWNPKYESATAEGYNANDFDPSDINTPAELAWLISHVNGLNGATAHPDAVANITADIDMSESIWVPIGSVANAFTGTFEGNGHVITGLISPLVQTNMAMFGNTNGATIQNVVAKAEFQANSANMGTLVGTMTGGTLSNVEAAGHLIGGTNTVNMGGLVGNAVSGTIHSAFSVNEMTGSTNTIMGGLVGTNGADLYNSYANVTMTGSNTKGGLVGVNNEGHTVENCYVVLGQQEYPAFAYTNNGSINYCYVDKAGTEVGDSESTGTVSKSGTYGAVQSNIKHLDYMYRDNMVTAPEENTYANHENPTYLNNHTVVWNGLLSVLNQWVTAKNAGYTKWNRPITTTINGDLPVLAFPKDNSMATTATDGKFLQYAAYNLEHTAKADAFDNGIDGLLANTNYTNIFLYGNATEVANVPAANTHVFINEDAVLLQSGNGEFINTTVGVTFDNSKKTATDYYGNTLAYDWHFMSTPLANAAIGATYGEEQGNGNDVNLSSMTDGYFPNGLTPMNGDIKWDFYSYYEPEYHWINLKRTDHFHIDGGASINYTNETNFVPGKGYMMAISQDSYMNSTGTLNNGDVEITLYKQESQAPAPEELYNEGWNLVGNPYQAYLDLNKVGAGTYYIYDAESGVYVPYTVQGSENPVTPSRYIHPHQGFFMHTDTDNTTFTFGTSMATTTTDNGSYFRGDDRINYPLVNLFATNESGNTDLAIVEFNRPEIGGATKVSFMTNANFSIAAHLNGEGYGLLFAPEGTEKVPVHFKAQEDGTYTLTWSTYNGDFSSLLLVDNKTGVITDMLRADKYTFDATADDYSSRFYLTYSVTGIDDNEYEPTVSTFAYFDGSEWVVNGQGQLDVVDMLGRTLRSERLTNDQNRVSLNGVAQGVYLMRVTNGKAVKVQKIVVR